MVCDGKARKELQVHDIQWAVALQRANNHVLFNALVLSFLFPVSWGELAAFLFQKQEERWKVQSEEKCSVILQSISIPYQNYSEALFCNTYLYCILKMLPVYEAIIINPSLINQKQWQVLIDLYLYEATGCCLPASGKGECMLDHTGLPARGCCRDLSIVPFVFLAHGGTLCPGEGWGCWRIKMIKSGTRMCTEYFLLQKSDFQGYLFRVHNAMTLLERRMLKNCTVKWAWQLQVSAWGELLDGFMSLNYTTGGKAAFILPSSQVLPFLDQQDKLPTTDWTIPVN